MNINLNRDHVKAAAIFAGGLAIGALAMFAFAMREQFIKSGKNSGSFEKGSLGKFGHHGDKEAKEKIMREQLVRNYQYFGEKDQNIVRKSFVVVIGCGGVGRYLEF